MHFWTPTWLLIRCQQTLSLQLVEMMSPTFALSTLSHIEEALPSFFCGEDVGTVTATSGGEDGALGTFFAVFVQGTEIAKALVLYQSGDYDAEGPMLEHMEVTAEWQGKGIGSALLDCIEKFYSARWVVWPCEDKRC